MRPDTSADIPTRIGTPLSPSATRVMLLGAGELGKEVIIALQRLGVEVIAVDRYADAPGHQVAHRSHVIDMTDRAALRALIEHERPHFVVPEIEAIATEALAEIEDARPRRRHPDRARDAADDEPRRHPPSRRRGARPADLAVRVRRFARRAARRPPSRSAIPCVVKPVMSSSGKGQSVLESADDVEAAWEYALAGGRVNTGRVIVEGFIDFDYEITQLTVRALRDGEVEPLLRADRPPAGSRRLRRIVAAAADEPAALDRCARRRARR